MTARARGRSLLRRRALLVGVALLVLTATVTSFFGDRGYLELRRYQHQRATLDQEIRRLEVEVRRLQRDILALRKDPQALERLAREELILARPGEIVFLYPRDEDEGMGGTARPPAVPGTGAEPPAERDREGTF